MPPPLTVSGRTPACTPSGRPLMDDPSHCADAIPGTASEKARKAGATKPRTTARTMPLVQRLCPLPLSKSGTSGYIFGMKPLRDSGSLGSMRLSIRALGLVSGLLVSFLAVAPLSPLRAHAQAYDTAELEALLAPVALQPDAVLWQVLDAATTPNEVQEAAAWSQANPGIEGSDAVRAVQDYDWQPAVKTLVAYPDLLARMAESPQWLE